MYNVLQTICLPAACYLFGSIQFGYVFVKLFLKKDVTKIGSRSTGTTNVLRLGNKYIGAATLLCDILKGLLPAIIIKKYCNVSCEMYYSSLFACLIGHIYPIFFKFKGGKGIATMFGIYLYISHFIALIDIILYAATLILYNKSFIASLAMCTFFTFIEVIPYACDNKLKIFLYSTLLVVFFSHRKNIRDSFVQKNRIE